MKKKYVFILILSLVFSMFVNAQASKVSGTVQDAKGQPIAGASVSVVNPNQSSLTDAQGVFSLSVKPGAVINITAVGFADTSIAVNNTDVAFVITLRATVNSLGDVVVSGKSGETPPSPGEVVINDQVISNALDEFVKSNGISEGTTVYSGVKLGTIIVNNKLIGGLVNISMTRNTPLNLLVNSDGLPAFHTVEETKGSRYLYNNKWVKGLVVDQNNTIMANPNMLFNYDKIGGNLLATQDMKTFIALDKSQVKSFALKSQDDSYIYERVPAINNNVFFQVLAKGTKYCLYKMTTTKFEKNNYISNGLTESGHNYDEYIDASSLFVVDVQANDAKQITVRKKILKEVFAGETSKLHKYFSQHDDDDLDENFVIGLIDYLNK